ncbi:hypothetical protein E8E11_002058 [Didymella keratinophila]|nr:hypothetical protein E8E11_002058 [Didymella keratinophila]
MDRKISEEFGEAVLASVKRDLEGDGIMAVEQSAKKRRFWRRRDDRSGDEVPLFAPMPLDIWSLPAMKRTPAGKPHVEEVGIEEPRGHKKGRSGRDSAPLHSRESISSDDTNKTQGNGVWNWLRSSFGVRVETV